MYDAGEVGERVIGPFASHPEWHQKIYQISRWLQDIRVGGRNRTCKGGPPVETAYSLLKEAILITNAEMRWQEIGGDGIVSNKNSSGMGGEKISGVVGVDVA
jgi:hypothetical protein